MAATPARDLLLSNCARTLIRVRAIQLSRRPGFRRADRDDLRQEMFLDLLRRVDRFDPRLASATTFVHRVVKCSISNILRTRRSLRRAGELDALSVERTMCMEDGRLVPASETICEEDLCRRIGSTWLSVVERIERSEAMMHAYNALRASERDVWRLLTSHTPTAVARQMAISRRRVRNIMATIRRQLEQAGLENF